MSILSRLEEFILHKKMSLNKFEDSVNVSRGGISGAIRNNRNVGINVIENILYTYPELNVKWLLKGEGEMLINSDEMVNEPHLDYSYDRDEWLIKEAISHFNLSTKTELIEFFEQFNEKKESAILGSLSKKIDKMDAAIAEIMMEVDALKNNVKQKE